MVEPFGAAGRVVVRAMHDPSPVSRGDAAVALTGGRTAPLRSLPRLNISRAALARRGMRRMRANGWATACDGVRQRGDEGDEGDGERRRGGMRHGGRASVVAVRADGCGTDGEGRGVREGEQW